MQQKVTGSKAFIGRIDNLEKTINDALNQIDFRNHVKSDMHVFVKPNFTFPAYKEGVTTTPTFLKHLLSELKDRADRVTIIESNGGNNVFTAHEAFQGHNMFEISNELGIELVNLSDMPTTWISQKILSKTVKVQIPQFLTNGLDCFISVPVIKVHAMTSVSLSIKNLWGCFPDPMRCLHHSDLDRKLALLCKLWDPNICIIDGTFGLDGHGPMFGQSVKLDMILAANNPVVADSLCARIMGFNPRNIGHIRIAEDEGLGISDISRISLNRDWRSFFHKFSFTRTPLDILSLIPFHSQILAKLFFDSPFTKPIRRVADVVRTEDEKEDLRSYVR